MSGSITARRRAEEERRAVEAQLRQSRKLESIGTPASGIANGINDPPTGVVNGADLIKPRVVDPQPREPGDGMKSEGARMAEIARGLLSFARQKAAESGRSTPADIVCASLAPIGAVVRKGRIRLEPGIGEGIPRVRHNA